MSSEGQNLFQELIAAHLQVGAYKLYWLEFVGILIGVVSAWLGMKRWVWAWPVGISANIMLFGVYLGAVFGADERIPLFGQAGRQVFFIVTSIYGWWRWTQVKKQREGVSQGSAAIVPRWASATERIGVLAVWVLGTVLAHRVFVVLWDAAPNPYWHPEWWYFWSDAWIFVGSMLATYMMARGWNEFWLAWIAVDLVGVPLGFATGYVPTAVMYIGYGAFVLYGFTRWVQATRESQEVPRPQAEPRPSGS